MGILFNKKKEWGKDIKKVKTEEYSWITEEQFDEMLYQLKEYCNEIFVTKEELDNKLYDSNKEPYIPKKADKIISNKDRRLVMFREDQLNKIIEQAKDYINLHYVTKVELEHELNHIKESSCKCGGNCKCSDKNIQSQIEILDVRLSNNAMEDAISAYKNYTDKLEKDSNNVSRNTTNK